jgi:aspartate carbamoyltransferase regulatory subunit
MSAATNRKQMLKLLTRNQFVSIQEAHDAGIRSPQETIRQLQNHGLPIEPYYRLTPTEKHPGGTGCRIKDCVASKRLKVNTKTSKAGKSVKKNVCKCGPARKPNKPAKHAAFKLSPMWGKLNG